MNSEWDREIERCVVPFRVLDAIVVVVVNKSKEFHYASLKVGNAFGSGPRASDKPHALRCVASRRISAAQLKPNDAPLAVRASPQSTAALLQPRPQLSPFWATVCSANLSFCQISVAAWVEAGQPVRSSSRGQRQESTARRRSEWMWLTVQYAKGAKLTNETLNWITLRKTSRARIILNLFGIFNPFSFVFQLLFYPCFRYINYVQEFVMHLKRYLRPYKVYIL